MTGNTPKANGRGGNGRAAALVEAVESRMLMSGTPVPVGNAAEFPVNGQTTGGQYSSLARSVATDAHGNVVVAWTSQHGQDGSGSGVFARRYDAAGNPIGGEFRVNTYTAGDQSARSVAMNGSGQFVIVWNSLNQAQPKTNKTGSGSAYDVYAQRYDAFGKTDGGEFLVNTTIAASQYSPTAGMADDGSLFVAWTSENQDPKNGRVAASNGIYAQRFDTAGAKAGDEFRVNTYTPDGQFTPSVAVDGAGNCLVAWTSAGQDGDDYGIYAQRYDASGAVAGGEFRVNAQTAGRQHFASAALLAGGGFAVAWDHNMLDGTYGDVHMRRHDGTNFSDEVLVNSYTAAHQGHASLAVDNVGNTTVVWHSNEQDGSGRGVYGQQYDPAGQRRGSEFQVNSYTSGDQSYASAAAQPDGRFVTAWSGQDVDGQGVYARLFQPPAEPALEPIVSTTSISDSTTVEEEDSGTTSLVELIAI